MWSSNQKCEQNTPCCVSACFFWNIHSIVWISLFLSLSFSLTLSWYMDGRHCNNLLNQIFVFFLLFSDFQIHSLDMKSDTCRIRIANRHVCVVYVGFGSCELERWIHSLWNNNNDDDDVILDQIAIIIEK